MTANKHTPGPWTVLPEELDRDYIRVRGTQLGKRYKIANVPTPTNGVEREAEETRANARLIAAAPELLEAIQKYRARVASCRSGQTHSFALAQYALDAAIAKATGGQP